MNLVKSILNDMQAMLLIFFCILAVYGLSYYKRQASYTHWMENRSEYVVEHVTAMSTSDAYFWLKLARDMDAGKMEKEQIDPLRAYPDVETYIDTPNLLTRLISISKNFTGGDYYRAALLLVPILAGLFVFPLFLYSRALGFGASAVLGGLIGSFSVSYYSRSDLGYVDTDMLNTFFPLAVSSFIVLINRDRPFRATLLLAIGAGLAMSLFHWWYQQPAFFLVYLLFLALYLFLIRLPWKQTAFILLAFTMASGHENVLQSFRSLSIFLEAFFFPRPTGQIVWPDIMTTIIEAKATDTVTKLQRLHGLLPVVFAGLAGLLYLYIVRFRKMVPITPIVLLGAWSLVGPRRFTMYLAPFIGLGVGVLIELLVRQAGERLGLRPIARHAAVISLMLALFFSTTGFTAYDIVPSPIVPASTTRAILEIKRIVPKHSAMFTWWDSGNCLMEIGEFATYHDNSFHGDSRTTLVGKALTSADQGEMVALLSYLDENGFDGLKSQIEERNLSGDQMMQMVLTHPREFRGENVHILYTEAMIDKIESITMFGTWDFNRKASDPMIYRSLTCFSLADNILSCRGGKADLNRGILTDGSVSFPLKAALFVIDGHVVDRVDYPAAEGYYLQILKKKGTVDRIQVVEERLFRTNFNQQYLLGNYDRRYFEEVYNDFPVARVLKVKNP